MSEVDLKTSTANVVEGFSTRFNYLMTRAGIPEKNRVNTGSSRFDVVPNTFRSWCLFDKIPGKHSTLLEIVEDLLKDIGGRHNTRAVVAWLLAGDAVPNPFESSETHVDALLLVNLYVQIADFARREGIDFEKLPRDVQNLVLSKARASLSASDSHEPKLEGNTLAMVRGMLEMARTFA